jgi:hypothetical protein
VVVDTANLTTVITPRDIVTQNVILAASNIRVVSNTGVVYGEATRTELPDTIYAAEQLIQNCVSAPAYKGQVSLQRSFQRSSSVQLQHSVTHTHGEQVGLQWKLSDSFTISGQLTIQDQETNGRTTIDAAQQSTVEMIIVAG